MSPINVGMKVRGAGVYPDGVRTRDDRLRDGTGHAALPIVALLLAMTACSNMTPEPTNGPVVTPQPPDMWQSVMDSEHRFNAVAWSESLSRFVAVGWHHENGVETGIIVQSPDGVSWTEVALDAGVQGLTGVAWSEELSVFVAVGVSLGSGGTVLYSDDADTWTPVTGAPSFWLDGVTWSESRSLFVAVGSGRGIVYSSDGLNWTDARVARSTSEQLNAVTWSEKHSRFVAVGGGGTVLYSDDGNSWSEATSIGESVRLSDVTWSESLSRFVAVGTSSGESLRGIIVQSSDGVRWTETASSGALPILHGVSSSGSHFVAVGETIVHSTDAEDWTEAGSRGTSQLFLLGVAWNGTRFVAVGSGVIVASS